MPIEDIKPTGRVVDGLVITGYLMPWYVDIEQPVLLSLPGGSHFFLPIFSTAEKLREAIPWMNPRAEWEIKVIEDGAEFLESVRSVRVGADPYIHDGNTRWLEVRRSLSVDAAGR